MLITRPIAIRILKNKTTRTNVDAIVGMEALVTENVDVLPPHARDFSRELGGFLLES